MRPKFMYSNVTVTCPDHGVPTTFDHAHRTWKWGSVLKDGPHSLEGKPYARIAYTRIVLPVLRLATSHLENRADASYVLLFGRSRLDFRW